MYLIGICNYNDAVLSHSMYCIKYLYWNLSWEQLKEIYVSCLVHRYSGKMWSFEISKTSMHISLNDFRWHTTTTKLFAMVSQQNKNKVCYVCISEYVLLNVIFFVQKYFWVFKEDNNFVRRIILTWRSAEKSGNLRPS